MIDRQEINLHVDHYLSEARTTMSPRVRRAFDDLLRARGLRGPEPNPYVEILGHPVFELPMWVAERLSAEGVATPPSTLAEVLGISALGYFHTRAQDDWLDGPSREDPTLVALAEALMAFCNRLLVSVVGSSRRFWDFYAHVINEYADSLLFTDELRRTDARPSRSSFERLLGQARPFAIPTAALLDRGDRWELRPHLDEFVLASSAVTQLFNDLTDIYRDRRMGHHTWTTERVGDSTADQLWTEVLDSSDGNRVGRIQELLDEALVLHERSARAVRALALAAADDWLADRRLAIVSLPDVLRRHLLATFITRMTGIASKERG